MSGNLKKALAAAGALLALLAVILTQLGGAPAPRVPAPRASLHVASLAVRSARCPNGVLYRPCAPHAQGWATQGPQGIAPPRAILPQPTHEMFDTITVATVPANPWAVAGYTSGFWPTFGPLVAAFPSAHHLSIAINAWHDADCADDEPLDLTNSQTVAWDRRQIALGHSLVCDYTSISNMGSLKADVANAGISLGRIKWWCAWYRFFPGLVNGCDAVQWTDTALGRNLDESTVRTDFFGPPPPPPGPSAATLQLWGQTKNGAFRHYHRVGCLYPQARNPYCGSDAGTVRTYQDKLWAANAPARWACFGPRSTARLRKSEVCWIVRPQASYWSGARDSSRRALARCLAAGPVSFPTPCRQRGTLAQRVRYFDAKATALVKAYS